jgi:phosphoribosylaminoimidazole-succinocarboxamide synthase
MNYKSTDFLSFLFFIDSMWTNYDKGVREYCGHKLADGMIKNQKLEEIKLTPTTKDDLHDELISAEEVVTYIYVYIYVYIYIYIYIYI